MPASIWRRPSRRTAASSSSPVRVNGVTSAVPTPVNGVRIVHLNLKSELSNPESQLNLQSQHILHREPAASALNPSRRRQRAAREAVAVARRMRQRDRFGRAVETNRVRARNRSRRASTTRRSAA